MIMAIVVVLEPLWVCTSRGRDIICMCYMYDLRLYVKLSSSTQKLVAGSSRSARWRNEEFVGIHKNPRNEVDVCCWRGYNSVVITSVP